MIPCSTSMYMCADQLETGSLLADALPLGNSLEVRTAPKHGGQPCSNPSGTGKSQSDEPWKASLQKVFKDIRKSAFSDKASAWRPR